MQAVITVRGLIDALKQFPDDWHVGFQRGDEEDSEILTLELVEGDPMWGIVDFVFKETDEGI